MADDITKRIARFIERFRRRCSWSASTPILTAQKVRSR